MGINCGPRPLEQGEYMYLDVRNCQRCGGNHDHTLFKLMTNAPDEWKWWGACPALHEPLLLRRVEMK